MGQIMKTSDDKVVMTTFCPVINDSASLETESRLEVMVKLDATGKPIQVICPEYIADAEDGKFYCNRRDDDCNDCIYTKWQALE